MLYPNCRVNATQKGKNAISEPLGNLEIEPLMSAETVGLTPTEVPSVTVFSTSAAGAVPYPTISVSAREATPGQRGDVGESLSTGAGERGVAVAAVVVVAAAAAAGREAGSLLAFPTALAPAVPSVFFFKKAIIFSA